MNDLPEGYSDVARQSTCTVYLTKLVVFRFEVPLGFQKGKLSLKYSVLINKWRTPFSLALNRDIANAIVEGACSV
jgi:hypothetical protein